MKFEDIKKDKEILAFLRKGNEKEMIIWEFWDIRIIRRHIAL